MALCSDRSGGLISDYRWNPACGCDRLLSKPSSSLMSDHTTSKHQCPPPARHGSTAQRGVKQLTTIAALGLHIHYIYRRPPARCRSGVLSSGQCHVAATTPQRRLNRRHHAVEPTSRPQAFFDAFDALPARRYLSGNPFSVNGQRPRLRERRLPDPADQRGVFSGLIRTTVSISWVHRVLEGMKYQNPRSIFFHAARPHLPDRTLIESGR